VAPWTELPVWMPESEEAYVQAVLDICAREAIDTNGAWKGGWLTLARLCRCHPWGAHGIDLVPEPRHSPASPADQKVV